MAGKGSEVRRALAVLAVLGVGCATVGPGHDVEAARAYLEEGRAAAQKGDHRSAVDCYTKALRVHPEFPDAYYERGYSHVQLRRGPGVEGDARFHEEKALDDYTRAIRYNPTLSDAYYNRAMIRASRAQYKPAVEDLLNAVRYKPNDPEPHFWLGRLYEQKFEDRVVPAMEHYEKYVEGGGLDPEIREKVKLWKDLKQAAAAPPPSKAPMPDDERKAEDLHEAFKRFFAAGQRTEARKAIEELLSKYGHAHFVLKRQRELNALLNALRKETPQ